MLNDTFERGIKKVAIVKNVFTNGYGSIGTPGSVSLCSIKRDRLSLRMRKRTATRIEMSA